MAEETMEVRVVSETSKVGVYIKGHTPTWNPLLGETVVIRPETAEFTDKGQMRVRVQATVLTGQKARVKFTPLTNMLVLTPEQEATVRRYARVNSRPKTTEAPPIEQPQKRMPGPAPGML